MTVIVWDGTTLAADRRASFGGFHRATTKIARLSDGSLAGFAGDAAYCTQAMHWLQNGAVVADFPATQRDRDKFAGVLIVKPDRTVWKLEDTPHPFQVLDPHFAIGGGRDFAMAALYLGHNAETAVMVASAMDAGCGNGIDTLTLEPTE